MRPSPDDASIKLPYYRMADAADRIARFTEILPATRMWGFGSIFAGTDVRNPKQPRIDCGMGERAATSAISCPLTMRCMARKQSLPEVRSVIHLHGGKTPPDSDGYPEHWYVPGKSATFHYPNRQDAAMLFYHDHTMGINRLEYLRGIAGHVFHPR